MSKKRERSLAETSVLLGILTLGSYLTAVLLQVVLAAQFGAGDALDAFFVGNALPRIMVQWFLVSMSSIVLVPLLTEATSRYGEEEANRISNTFTTMTAVFLLTVIVVGLVFAGPICRALAPGHTPEVHALSVKILRVMLFNMVFAGIVAFCRGFLHSERRFLYPAIAQNAQLIVTVLFVWFGAAAWGIWSAAIGTVVGMVIAAAILMVPMSRTHFRLSLGLDLRDPIVRRILSLFVPFLVLGAGAQINFLSDRWFASFLFEGAVSIITFADAVVVPIMGVFSLSVTLPMFTVFSEHSAAENAEAFRATVESGIRSIAIISLPVVAIFVALREPTMRFLLARGAFTTDQALAVADQLLFLTPALVTWSFAVLMVYAIFSTQDVKWCVKIILIEIAANIVLDIILVRVMGLPGLALATSLAVTGSNIIIWTIFSRKIGGLDFAGLFPYTAKVGGASVLAGVVAGLVGAALGAAAGTSKTADFFVCVIAGGVSLAIYALLLTRFRVPQWLALRERVARKLSGTKEPA